MLLNYKIAEHYILLVSLSSFLKIIIKLCITNIVIKLGLRILMINRRIVNKNYRLLLACSINLTI